LVNADLSFPNGISGKEGYQVATTAEFHVYEIKHDKPRFDVILGCEFLTTKTMYLSPDSIAFEPAALKGSVLPQQSPSKVHIGKDSTTINTAPPKTGQPSEPQPVILPLQDDLEIWEPKDPARRGKADIIFILERSKTKRDFVESSRLFGWSLNLLRNDAPGTRIVHFKCKLQLQTILTEVQLGRILLRNLLLERRDKPSISTIPLLFICYGRGLRILQAMIDAAIVLSNDEGGSYFDADEFPDVPELSYPSLSRELLQRLQTIVVFDISLGNRLQGTSFEVGASSPVLAVPVFYLRPTRIPGLQGVLHWIKRPEPRGRVMYLPSIRLKGRRDINYLSVLGLILAHIESRDDNVQPLPDTQGLRQNTITTSIGNLEVSDNSTLNATSIDQVKVRDSSIAAAFSTGQINAVDSTLFVSHAGQIAVSGNCVVQIQDCSHVSASGGAVVQIQNCSHCSASGNAVIQSTHLPQPTVQVHEDSNNTLVGTDGPSLSVAQTGEQGQSQPNTADDLPLPVLTRRRATDLTPSRPSLPMDLQHSTTDERITLETPVLQSGTSPTYGSSKLLSDQTELSDKIENLGLSGLRVQCQEVLLKIQPTSFLRTQADAEADRHEILPSILNDHGLYTPHSDSDLDNESTSESEFDQPSGTTFQLYVACEILKFMETEFSPDQPIADIFVLTGSADRPKGLTCHEFMSSR